MSGGGAAIVVECPSCGVRIRAPAASAGRTARCPRCQGVFQFPDADRPPVAPAVEEAFEDGAAAPAAPPAFAGRRAGPRIPGRSAPGRSVRTRYARKKSGPGQVISLIAAGVIAVAAAGVGIFMVWPEGGGGKAASPQDLFAEVQAAVLRNDWGAFYDAVLPSIRRKAEAEWEARKQESSTPEAQAGMTLLAAMLGVEKERIPAMSYRDIFVATMGKLGAMPGTEAAAVRNSVVVGSSIAGGRGHLLIRADGKDTPFPICQEEGRWYMEIAGLVPNSGMKR